jgi:hypothetical protein
MEVWSSHPNFKLSTILNLKDVRQIPKPKHTSIEKRKHESINTRFTQTDVRTLNGELENHCFFIIFYAEQCKTVLMNAI